MAGEADTQQHQRNHSRQHQLLIVDDDPELRRFLAGELEAEGYATSEAANGQNALVKIRESPWDLVILDWTLPDFSGVEVCRRLRSSGGTAGLIQSVSQVLWPELPAWGLVGGIASSLCPKPPLPQLILI